MREGRDMYAVSFTKLKTICVGNLLASYRDILLNIEFTMHPLHPRRHFVLHLSLS